MNDDFELKKSKLRKKAIICGIIVLCCIIVMTVTIIISVRNKNKPETAQKAAKKTQSGFSV